MPSSDTLEKLIYQIHTWLDARKIETTLLKLKYARGGKIVLEIAFAAPHSEAHHPSGWPIPIALSPQKPKAPAAPPPAVIDPMAMLKRSLAEVAGALATLFPTRPRC
jgi:hypothetical protein